MTAELPTHTTTTTAALLLFLICLLLDPLFAVAQYPDSEDRRNPPAATIVIILIGVLFVLTGFLSIYLRHHAAGCFGIEQGGTAGVGWNRPVQRGLDPAVIQTFPVYLYSHVKVHRKGEVALECAVCLNEYEGHESLRLLPVCNHVFHPHCVDPWLVTRGTCPVCRENLEKVTGFAEEELLPQRDPSASPPPLQAGAESDASDHNERDHHAVTVDRSPEIRRSPTPEIMNESRPPSRGILMDRIIGRFPRSHSTGHSLLPFGGDDWERFTLRLPVEARSKLVNLNRLTGNGPTLSALTSPKRGFRPTTSGAGNYYQRWGLSMTPPFISRARSPAGMSDGEEWNQTSEQAPRGGFLKSLSPLIDRIVRGGGGADHHIGTERSSDHKIRPPSFHQYFN